MKSKFLAASLASSLLYLATRSGIAFGQESYSTGTDAANLHFGELFGVAIPFLIGVIAGWFLRSLVSSTRRVIGSSRRRRHRRHASSTKNKEDNENTLPT